MPGSALQRIKRWLPFVVLVVAAVLVAREGIAGAWMQRRAIGEGVPGFSCPGMTIEVVGGSWSSRGHVMESSLRMPETCRSDLRRRIRGDPGFHATRCNLVERCWQRTANGRSYTFTFQADRTDFHFAR